MRFFRRPESPPQPAVDAPEAEAQTDPDAPSALSDAVVADATDAEVTAGDPLEAGLERSRGGFMTRLRGFFAAPEGPDWEHIEETLIAGDIGPALAMAVVEAARGRDGDGAGAERAVEAELARRLMPRDPDWRLDAARTATEPAVALVVGVNGTGKTTTIGKLAAREQRAGRRVLLAAADTFRAAAIEQLEAWGRRVGADVIAHNPNADPGAVVYDSLDAAVARHADLVLVDTAGRLHTKSNLMDELAKIRRIVNKRLPGAEPETLFVLDATTGQNGLAQAKAFHASVVLTGIVLTKLDSTAKGGIVFAIEDQLGVPVRFVGVGEGVDDLLPFDPEAFVAALFETQ
jgi:fused signal recognition particle receptor